MQVRPGQTRPLLYLLIPIILIIGCDFSQGGGDDNGGEDEVIIDPAAYAIPLEMIEAVVNPGTRNSFPVIYLTISDEFQWPAVPEGKEGEVRYRMDIQWADKETIYEGASYIDSEERFGLATRLPQFYFDLLAQKPETVEEFLAGLVFDETTEITDQVLFDESELFASLASEFTGDPDLNDEKIDQFLDNLTAFGFPGEVFFYSQAQLDVYDAVFFLTPVYDDNTAIVTSSGTGALKKQVYKWGTKVAKADDPCDGKLPEECAGEKVDGLIKKICDAMKDGKQRFPKQCKELRRLQQAAGPPPPFTIECKIPPNAPNAGTIGGFVRTTDGTLTLSGEYMIRFDCPDYILLHEASHVLDYLDGKFKDPDIQKYFNLKGLIENTKAGKGIVITDPAARQKFIDQQKEKIKKVNQKAFDARVSTECAAHAVGFEEADFFGHPGDKKATAWVKSNALIFLSAIVELIKEHSGYGKVDYTTACGCLKQLQSFIIEDPVIKKNMMSYEVEGGEKKNIVETLETNIQNLGCK